MTMQTNQPPRPSVSIVLPVYNQADHIAAIVSEYEAGLTRLPCDHELLLVLNGCKDNSQEICQGLEEHDPHIRVLRSERAGWGGAVKLGLSEARGELLCYTNSARTDCQILTLAILYAMAHPGTVIKANRKIRESLSRRMGSLLYNLECRALFDLACWDVNGTPKVFPRSFDKLLTYTRDDDTIDAEFNMICRNEGYPMLELPIFSTKRHGGRSTTSMRSALKLYVGAYSLWRAQSKAG